MAALRLASDNEDDLAPGVDLYSADLKSGCARGFERRGDLALF
jgi:hypothetical protein